MSKRKRKDQSAEQPARANHSPEQVKEVALMLYAQKPFPLYSEKSKLDFELLVCRALNFLDTLEESCEKVAIGRQAAKEENAWEDHLPAVVPFNKALKFITDQKRLDRAIERLVTVVLRIYYVDEASLSRALTDWRENGMERSTVIGLRKQYDERAYRRSRIATAGSAKKRRAPWSEQRRRKALLESAARKAKKER